jgi:hypothetical protein
MKIKVCKTTYDHLKNQIKSIEYLITFNKPKSIQIIEKNNERRNPRRFSTNESIHNINPSINPQIKPSGYCYSKRVIKNLHTHYLEIKWNEISNKRLELIKIEISNLGDEN